MKLIHCHIENFGRLRNFSCDFSEGVNTVCRENGWGKSTFAAFLCAMFYGLPASRKKNAKENLRERYRPWQGGIYGGMLVFAAGGREYEMRRVFGKREAEDVFELRDAATNLPSFDFSKKTGEELFGLDRESFLRTVFTAQQDCATKATDDVNARIGDLAERAGDMGAYETAMKRLADAANRLSPVRQTGSIYRRGLQIEGLSRTSAGKDDAEEELRACAERQSRARRQEAALEKELQELEAELEYAGKMAEREQIAQERVRALAGQRELQKRLSQVREQRSRDCVAKAVCFPGRVPSREETDRILKKCREMERLEDRMQDAMLTEDEQRLLTELEAVYENKPDPAGEAGSKESGDPDRKRERKRENEAERKESGKDSSRGAFLQIIFAAGAVLLLLGTAAVAAVRVHGLFFAPADPSAGLSAAFGPGLFLAVTGGLLLGAGALLQWRAGRGHDSEREDPDSRNRRRWAALLQREQKVEELHAQWTEARKPILEFLRELGFAPEEDLYSQLLALRDSADEYEDAMQRLRETEDELMDLESRIREETSREKDEDGIREDISREKDGDGIREDISRKKDEDGIREDISREKDGDGIRESISRDRYEGTARKAAAGEAPGKPALRAEIPDPGSLRKRETEIRSSLYRLHDEIKESGREMEDLLAELQEREAAEQELRLLRSEQEQDRKKYEYVTAAAGKLKEARETMTSRYAEPIRENFHRYWEMATGYSAAGIRVDADSVVTVEEAGKQRRADQLSTGYEDLAGICLRLALADAMYLRCPGGRPPLIMDDPFTNLDDEKTAGGLKLLQEAGKDYQILYFTCSSSRC